MRRIACEHWSLIAAGVIALWLAGCVGRYGSLLARSRPEMSAADCGQCHQDIFSEWRDSPHARSSSNANYQFYSDRDAVDACRGCHEPATIFTEGRIPGARVTRIGEGVNCAACHYACGSFRGPLPVSYKPHPVLVDEGFRDSAMCRACHRKTYAEWEAAPFEAKVSSCQGCHMRPVVQRRMAKPSITSRLLFSTPRIVKTRSHLMALEAISNFPDAARVEMTYDQAGTQTLNINLRVTNRLPHGIPTGQYGYRKATVVAELIGAEEEILAERSKDFFVELGTQLKPLQEHQIPFRIEGVALSLVEGIHVRLERSSLEGEKRIVIGTWEFPFDAQPHAEVDHKD